MIDPVLLSPFVAVMLWLGQVGEVMFPHSVPAAPPTCVGLTGCNAGSTVQASGHTCTISGVTLATGNSIVGSSATPGLGGTVTATWNGSSMTEQGAGDVYGSEEMHTFYLNNVTGATGNLVFTKTSAGDDSKIFNCVGIRINGLTTHNVDQHSQNGNAASTSWGSPTVNTAQATSVLVGVVQGETNTGTTIGTWDAGWTRLARVGQTTGSCCVIDYGFQVTSSTGAFLAQVTGNANVAQAGFVANFY